MLVLLKILCCRRSSWVRTRRTSFLSRECQRAVSDPCRAKPGNLYAISQLTRLARCIHASGGVLSHTSVRITLGATGLEQGVFGEPANPAGIGRIKCASTLLLLCSSFVRVSLIGQSDRGTITGTVSDPAGAVVPGAAVEARNTETAAVYPVAASSTGNYTIPELPSGTYELTVTAPGFKKFIRPGLIVEAAQTIRADAALEVGSASESVTVQDVAPLLKTESGEVSNTIATKTMDTLPLLAVGSNSSGIRNPFNIVALLPGAYYQPGPPFTGPTVRINGGVAGSESLLIDGMDGTNILGQGANQQNQPGMDSIQEWTVQTSNYSAEFGQAGSSVMNVTMKSGTNILHGSAYEYFQNEFLNAGQPFTNSGGQLLRPQQRRNDYGFTLGGPVEIPKVYHGRNKTFFFWSWEQFLQGQNFLPGTFSVPTSAYRTGDFSAAITAAGNKSLGTDPLGRPILADMIYNPTTRSVAPGGQIVTDPFSGNKIPQSFWDPVALKIQNLIPAPFCVTGPALQRQRCGQ